LNGFANRKKVSAFLLKTQISAFESILETFRRFGNPTACKKNVSGTTDLAIYWTRERTSRRGASVHIGNQPHT
jgi:hypothetical protein